MGSGGEQTVLVRRNACGAGACASFSGPINAWHHPLGFVAAAVNEAAPGGKVAVEMLNCQSPLAVALQPYAKLEKRPRGRGGREPGATCRG